MVLQRPRDDLAGAGAVLVHQNDHREARQRAVLRGRGLPVRRGPALGLDDDAVVNKQVRHLDGRFQDAARVEPQVQDQPLQPLLQHAVDGLAQVGHRVLDETGHPHVPDLLFIIKHVDPLVVVAAADALDGGHLDDRPRDGDRLGLARHVADRDRDLRARLARQRLDRVVQLDAVGALALDLGDGVAGHNARLVRRRVLDGADDRQHAVPHADLDADAAELASRRLVELVQLVFRDEVRKRVQARQHAVDGVAEHLLRVHVVDVLLLHQPQNLDEPVGLAEQVLGVLGLRLRGADRPHQPSARHQHQEDRQ